MTALIYQGLREGDLFLISCISACCKCENCRRRIPHAAAGRAVPIAAKDNDFVSVSVKSGRRYDVTFGELGGSAL
jgi:threonine dehydrogenase-like Zn-dependent dehydrogenase